MERVFATSSSEMSIPSAISSTVGSRPSSCSSAEERFPMRCSVPARFNGTRTMRDCSASAWRIAWRIHQTAYEMNLMPLVSSNLCAARIRPRLPSLIKSESDTPWFWYFLATDTTNRRLDRTSLSSASGSCCLIRWASATSSSRVISGYWLISRRYWSSDPSSNEARFAVFNCMAVSPLRAGTTPRDTGRPAAPTARSVAGSPLHGPSVDHRAEPAPANIGQPGERIVRFPVVAEVDDERPTFHRERVHEPPITRVRGVVAIVPQHEKLARRHQERPPGVARRAIQPRRRRPADQVVLLPVELRIVHVVPRIDPLHVGLHQRRAVHPDRAPAHLDPVARHADDALHVVQFGILRVGEHDDVAAARRLEPWEPRVGAGDLRPVHRLVHEQEVAGEQRALHAARRNLKGFDEKRADDEEQHERHAQRAHPVVEPPRQGGAASLLGGEGHRRGVRARTFLESPQLVHGFYFSDSDS